MDFLTSGPLIPYSIALVVLLGLLLLELVSLVSGSTLDSVMPDLDFDTDGDLSGFAVSLFHLGRVPLSVLTAIFLGGFSVTGMVGQWALGGNFPNLLLIPIAIVAGLAAVAVGGRLVRHILPTDETYAVKAGTFVGQVAVITQGDATADLSAQARLIDAHGQPHYLQVVPVTGEPPIPQGTEVLILSLEEGRYRVVRSDLTP